MAKCFPRLFPSSSRGLLGGLVDAGDGSGEGLVIVLSRHSIAETFDQRPGEARNHAVLLGEESVGLIPAVATREGNDSDALGMIDKNLVLVHGSGDRELEHHVLTFAEGVET